MLSTRQIEQFRDEGFVKIEHAFTRELAEETAHRPEVLATGEAGTV
jgi:hypothetical protein